MYENLWTNLEKYSRSRNLACAAIIIAAFCRIPANGQNLVLSGMDVAKAGAGAGYTYFTTGSIPDTFVLKAPVTVGTLKSAFSYAQDAGLTRILLVCAVAVLLPILLALFSMCMLLLAEGKKTMVFPTLFTAVIMLELAVVFCRISGTETVFPEGGVFVCDTGCHCHGLHYDWMVHRRILQTKNGRRPGKTGA